MWPNSAIAWLSSVTCCSSETCTSVLAHVSLWDGSCSGAQALSQGAAACTGAAVEYGRVIVVVRGRSGGVLVKLIREGFGTILFLKDEA